MKIKHLWLLPALGCLCVSSSLRAGGGHANPMTEVHMLLHRALEGSTSGTPGVEEQMSFLKQAKEMLKHAPPGRYRNHRNDAIQFIDSALYELGKGDAENKAKDYIRHADDNVRDIE